MTSLLSPSKLYGGTLRFTDAGEPSKTRPARSNFEPWQGQKNPPGQFGHHRGVTRRETRLRQAAEMRAGGDEHEDFRVERTRIVPGVLGLLGIRGLRVLEFRIVRLSDASISGVRLTT